MTAIAGIQSPHAQNTVKEMLEQMKHRGNDWCQIIEKTEPFLERRAQKTRRN